MRTVRGMMVGLWVIAGWLVVSAPAQAQDLWDDPVDAAPTAQQTPVVAQQQQQQPPQQQQQQMSADAGSGELVVFDFEDGTDDWSIPDWERTSADYAAKSVDHSVDFVSHGKGSLQMLVEFLGGKWTGAYVERQVFVTDWTAFRAVAADIYLPYNVPNGLKARFILTVGDKWEWTEMNRAILLLPDQWTTIRANLMPGSQDWKFFPDDSFRHDVRKVGIRIESEGEPAYTGPVYVDNIRLVR